MRRLIGTGRFVLLGMAVALCTIAAATYVPPAPAQGRDVYADARRRMVEDEIIAAGVTNERVIRAMLDTPRHEFVPLAQRQYAYFDMGLPIGEGQTISSPFIVAYMTESLDPQPTDKVLEIGTGSGYQAAVLSPLVREVYTIEIVDVLGRRAARTLDRLGYRNVSVRIGDGYQGWPEHAPFDKIIVTCSPERVPRPLVEQLRDGGRMVVPVGERYQQTLYLFTKKNGELIAEPLRPTLFVPMTGRAEAARQVQPDPQRPVLVNGDFEQPPSEAEPLPGWYYERLVEWIHDPRSPQGNHHVRFRNADPGRAARALQGFAIDGRAVSELRVSAWVKLDNVQSGRDASEHACIGLLLYDDARRQIGNWWIGPLRGTEDWHRVSRTFRIPPTAREGILRIGLFGATGTMAVDDVRIERVNP